MLAYARFSFFWLSLLLILLGRCLNRFTREDSLLHEFGIPGAFWIPQKGMKFSNPPVQSEKDCIINHDYIPGFAFLVCFF